MIRFILENASDIATLDTTPTIATEYIIDNVKKIS